MVSTGTDLDSENIDESVDSLEEQDVEVVGEDGKVVKPKKPNIFKAVLSIPTLPRTLKICKPLLIQIQELQNIMDRRG